MLAIRRWFLFVLSAWLAMAVTGDARAQSSTFNADAPGALRSWPRVGVWEVVLARRPDASLSCVMVSGKANGGQIEFVGGIRQVAKELALVLGDVLPAKLAGDQIALVVDKVKVGEFAVTNRIDNQGAVHMMAAAVPSSEAARIMNLFRTGGEVSFVTERATYTFPLTGAAQSLSNMHTCAEEAASLQPKAAAK